MQTLEADDIACNYPWEITFALNILFNIIVNMDIIHSFLKALQNVLHVCSATNLAFPSH